MKLKKYLLIIIMAIAFPVIANAQVYQSKSYVKKTTVTKDEVINPWKKCQWYGKIGARLPIFTYDSDMAAHVGADIDFGFKLRMGRHGWYWGMDLALYTGGLKLRDCDQEDFDFPISKTFVGGRLGLTNFGWRARFNDVILDLHAGLALEVNSAPNIESEYHWFAQEEAANVIIPWGVQVSYKKFLLDLTYMSAMMSKIDYQYGSINYNNFLISVGYLF